MLIQIKVWTVLVAKRVNRPKAAAAKKVPNTVMTFKFQKFIV